MQWSDEGIVLAARRHGERALVVDLLTREHGRHAGLLRGGQSPRARAHWQIGNRMLVHWSARLADHLGSLTGERIDGHAALLLDDRVRLAALASAASLATATLPEREPHPRAYAGLVAFVAALGADDRWAIAYIEWEMALLEELGFGLDLSCCASTGVATNLAFVSPRSGQAVSEEAGTPYRSRMLRLPPFLRPGGEGVRPASADVIDGLTLTGFFLERRVLAPHGRKLPAARGRYVDALTQVLTIASV
jgi:DNA repair protein RecO (recombination protein O)